MRTLNGEDTNLKLHASVIILKIVLPHVFTLYSGYTYVALKYHYL